MRKHTKDLRYILVSHAMDTTYPLLAKSLTATVFPRF